jgi:hypothetical protein
MRRAEAGWGHPQTIIGATALAVALGALVASPRATQAAGDDSGRKSYVPFQFSQDEDWRVASAGNAGSSRIDDGRFEFDFTQGADWVAVAPGRGTLMGDVKRLTLQVDGSTLGHPLTVVTHRYLATYRQSLGPIEGDGEHVLTLDAPPGPKWELVGAVDKADAGGPLRLGQIRIEAAGRQDHGQVHLVSVTAESSAPDNRCCRLTVVGRRIEPEKVTFEVEIRSLAPRGLKGFLSWSLANWEGRAAGPYRKDVKIPERGKPVVVKVEVPAMPPQMRFAEVTFSLHVEDQYVDPVSVAWVSPLGELGRTSGPDGVGWLSGAEGEGPGIERGGEGPDRGGEGERPRWRERDNRRGPEQARDSVRSDDQDLFEEASDVAEAEEDEGESPIGARLGLGLLPVQRREAVAELAKKAGVRWTQETFAWPSIEPQQGQYDWTGPDDVVRVADNHHISVLATVTGWPEWVTKDTPEALDAYVEFLKKLVDRYGDRVTHWEIWDAPNTASWSGSRELFAQLLDKVHTAIETSCKHPATTVVSTREVDLSFVREIVRLGGAFDVLGVRLSPQTLDESHLTETLRQAAEATRATNGPPRPVWLTQVGFPAYRAHALTTIALPAISQRAQAALLSRVYLAALGAGTDAHVFWQTFVDAGEDAFDPEQMLGVLASDLAPKPAYAALATVARVLRGHTLEGPVDTGRGNIAYRFTGGDAPLVAAWSTSGPADATLVADISKATVVDAIGEAHAIAPIVTDRGERLLRGESPAGAPVFIILRAPHPHEVPPPMARPGGDGPRGRPGRGEGRLGRLES